MHGSGLLLFGARGAARRDRQPDLLDITTEQEGIGTVQKKALTYLRHEVKVEQVAMQIARVFEEAAGANVHDVHTPDLACAVGLPDNPGISPKEIVSASE